MDDRIIRMNEYVIEWDEYEDRWAVETIATREVVIDCEFFDDLASAQEFKEKLEDNDGKEA